jgi:hypothetical protein
MFTLHVPKTTFVARSTGAQWQIDLRRLSAGVFFPIAGF